ncbi:glycosyltransferase family 2 protein [Patescibacteria group bacterium]|nr:glycosyltransferase family 2 protein [Patescibacteria group bacterium]
MDSENQPMVDIIIVSWNHAKFLPALFESLSKVNYPKSFLRVHLVINKDGDGSFEVAQSAKTLLTNVNEFIIHEPHANLGFSGGNNLAITWSAQRDGEFVYLLNPDTTVDPDFLNNAIKIFNKYPRVGSVQSLLLRGNTPEYINSIGNKLHFLGFGYCGGDMQDISHVPTEPQEIGYSSGAGVLISQKVLSEVGLLDETLFSYHEDLDLGWRIMLAGYKNIFAPDSVVYHFYEFSRSIQKWMLMERNRWIVVLKNYSFFTLLILLPSLIATDAAIWTFSLKGGWFWQKVKAMSWFLKPSSWKYIINGRLHIKQIRKVSDANILSIMTYKIEYQELRSGLAEKIANPFWKALYTATRIIIK